MEEVPLLVRFQTGSSFHLFHHMKVVLFDTSEGQVGCWETFANKCDWQIHEKFFAREAVYRKRVESPCRQIGRGWKLFSLERRESLEFILKETRWRVSFTEIY